MPTVMVTFVQAVFVLPTFVQVTFVLATFVHIRNISAVNDTILTKFWVRKFFFGPNKSKACKKIGFKKFDQILSVTIEIFLIWTNVARTKDARTNVTGTV